MNYFDYYANAKQPVETCVVGSGGFGRSFISQAQYINLMNARIAVDTKTSVAAETFKSLGIENHHIALCSNTSEALNAWARGKYIATDNLANVIDLPFDIVIEATGNPEAGAYHAQLAIENDHHVLLVSKEVDSVIGPWLTWQARQKRKVVTPADGDQPSLLIGLITWARTLGFEIIACGKSSEYDFVFNEESSCITSNGTSIKVENFSSLMNLGENNPDTMAQARSTACARLPQRAVPDLCELQVVANATGLTIDQQCLHAPIARISEIPDFMALLADGGLLSQTGILDVFHCLRRPDEASFAGGVFVIVECKDQNIWKILAEKGHILSRDQKRAMIYQPRHLLGLEAATSVLDAVIHGRSSGAQSPYPSLDLVARATQDHAKDTTLVMGGHHHSIDGITAELHKAQPASADTPVPFYLAANRKLTRDVRQGQVISYGDIEIDPASWLYKLRQEQDLHFFKK